MHQSSTRVISTSIPAIMLFDPGYSLIEWFRHRPLPSLYMCKRIESSLSPLKRPNPWTRWWSKQWTSVCQWFTCGYWWSRPLPCTLCQQSLLAIGTTAAFSSLHYSIFSLAGQCWVGSCCLFGLASVISIRPGHDPQKRNVLTVPNTSNQKPSNASIADLT